MPAVQILAGRPVESYAVRYRIRAQDAVHIQPGDRATVNGQVLKILATPLAPGEVGGQWVDVVVEALS